jgi:hypothetical protein
MVPPKIVRRVVRTLLSCQGKKKTEEKHTARRDKKQAERDNQKVEGKQKIARQWEVGVTNKR